MEVLANNLLRHRLRLGISQEKLARRLDVSLTTWGRWERGQAMPSILTLQRIATVLETTPSDLLREDSTK